MSSSTSLLEELHQAFPQLRSQIYFKAALTALSHALEDRVLAGSAQPLVIACFQEERFYQQEARRYQKIAQRSDQVYVFASFGDDIKGKPSNHSLISFASSDPLAKEWHLIVIDQDYSACLVCQEQPGRASVPDSMRQFKGFWTLDRDICIEVANRLLEKALSYQPKLLPKVKSARKRYELSRNVDALNGSHDSALDRLFTDRVLTYLQASQFKLLKTHTNLETLNKQLEMLERSQRNLIAIAGHELRTPLSTIQVCLETLSLAETLPSVMQEMLQLALEDSERLRTLIQDFLRLSRLESGLTHWQIEAIALQECLMPVLSSRKTASKPLPKLVVEWTEPLPLVLADRDGLTEVFSKLLNNADKFTTEAGTITIRTQVRDSELATLEIEIADTGQGIERNQMLAIFDRFYQEEGFLRRTIGGTGLGLAICRQIIQQLGGEIWATSAGKLQGSQFHFTIPIAIPS